MKKHKVKTQYNDWYGSISEYPLSQSSLCSQYFFIPATYDDSGYVDYMATFDASGDAFDTFTVAAGARVQKRLVDLSSRSGYSLIGAKPNTKVAMACEYYQLDWESGMSSLYL